MEDRIVVAEVDVLGVDRLPLTLFGQDLCRLEDLGDEHRPLARRRRREEVQVLPHGAANSARDADVVLESGPATLDRLEDHVAHDRAALGSKAAIVTEAEMARDV